MVTLEMLQGFCDSYRPEFARPWRFEDWTYAANGRMVARVRKDFGCEPCARPSIAEPVHALFEGFPPLDTEVQVPMPVLGSAPQERVCPRCGGQSANAARYTCPECDGSGRVEWKYEGDYDDYEDFFACPACKGIGTVSGCDECHGLGSVKDEECEGVEVAGRLFQKRYLRVILRLPHVVLYPRAVVSGCAGAMAFRCTGGEGLVMALRG